MFGYRYNPRTALATGAGFHAMYKPKRKGKPTYKKKKATKTRPKTSKGYTQYNKPSMRTPRTFPKTVKKQIRELKRLTESDTGTLTYRLIDSGRTTWAAPNAQSMSIIDGSTISKIEVALAQLRYYDTSTSPPTLVTRDATAGTFQKEFLIDNSVSTLTLRCNSNVPSIVKVYLCVPKRDTSITPLSAITDGLTDMCNVSETNVCTYPTDSPLFNDLWKIVKSKSYVLKSGQQCTCSHSEKPFQYDPSLIDEHNLAYQRQYKGHVWLVVQQGTISHDSTTNTNVGIGGTLLDYTIKTKYVVKYSAGADIKYLYCDSTGLDTMAVQPITGVLNVPDNIGFSGG